MLATEAIYQRLPVRIAGRVAYVNLARTRQNTKLALGKPAEWEMTTEFLVPPPLLFVSQW